MATIRNRRQRSRSTDYSVSSASDSGDESILQRSTRVNHPRSTADVGPQPRTTTRRPNDSSAPSQNNVIRRATILDPNPQSSRKSEKKTGVTIQVLATRSAAPESRRQRLLPRPDMDDYYSQSDPSRGAYQYRRPVENGYNSYFGNQSYVGPGAQAIPFDPASSYGQNPAPGYPPQTQLGSLPPHLRQYILGTPPPQPPQIPTGPDMARSDVLEEVDKVRKELEKLKEDRQRRTGEGSRDDEIETLRAELLGLKRAQEKQPMDVPRPQDLQALLDIERERVRKLEMEKQAIQDQAESEFQRRAEADTAAEVERAKREDEIRKETEFETRGRMEVEKHVQDEFQKAQLDQMQKMMERLGEQMAMMELKEAERRAAEQREKERLLQEQMEREAMQRLRDQKALQDKLEADRQAEAEAQERFRIEQEEREKAEREALERLKEEIRVQEEERIREEKAKQEEDRLVQEALENARREEERKRAEEEETRKRIEEGVKEALSEELKVELERLQYDLRRHTNGTRPAVHIGRYEHQRPQVLLDHQRQHRLDSAYELPSSNPWSRNRARVPFRNQLQDPRTLQDSYQLQGVPGNPLFGEMMADPSHWQYENYGQSQSYSEPYHHRPQQPFYAEDESTASSTPVSPRNHVHRHQNSASDTDGLRRISSNPYRFGQPRQQERNIADQFPRTQSDTGAPFSQYYEPLQTPGEQSAPEDARSTASYPNDFPSSRWFYQMDGTDRYPPRPHTHAPSLNGAHTQEIKHVPVSPNTNAPEAIVEYSKYQTGVENEEPASGDSQAINEDYRREEKDNESEVSSTADSKTRQGELLGGQFEVIESPDAQRERKARRPQPPPSGPPAPTPPRQMPPKPAEWKAPGQVPMLNGSRHTSNDRGTVAGFPPFSLTQQPQQQLLPQLWQTHQLSQGIAQGMLKNTPIVMFPFIPVYALQLNPGAEQIVTSQAPATEKAKAPMHSGEPYIVNAPRTEDTTSQPLVRLAYGQPDPNYVAELFKQGFLQPGVSAFFASGIMFPYSVYV